MVCAIRLTSETFTAAEGDGAATVCVEMLGAQLFVDVSVQLETVAGVGTATGIKTF